MDHVKVTIRPCPLDEEIVSRRTSGSNRSSDPSVAEIIAGQDTDYRIV